MWIGISEGMSVARGQSLNEPCPICRMSAYVPREYALLSTSAMFSTASPRTGREAQRACLQLSASSGSGKRECPESGAARARMRAGVEETAWETSPRSFTLKRYAIVARSLRALRTASAEITTLVPSGD